MVETIHATVHKDTADTKAGLKVLAKDGNVYVTTLTLLFENSGLQKGDRVVSINGNPVQGMTGFEVFNIIKGIEGDVNVVAERGATETIHTTVYKDSFDTEIGLEVIAKEGKVYVTNLSLLFEDSVLQKGDEVLMINGTPVEGMTNTQEVVDIIKDITGEVNVVAKRRHVTPVFKIEGPPGNAPAGGVWGTQKYIGAETAMSTCTAWLCFGNIGCCLLTTPTDERDAYCVNRKVYDKNGNYVGKQDNDFTPTSRVTQVSWEPQNDSSHVQ